MNRNSPVFLRGMEVGGLPALAPVSIGVPGIAATPLHGRWASDGSASGPQSLPDAVIGRGQVGRARPLEAEGCRAPIRPHAISDAAAGIWHAEQGDQQQRS